VVLALAGAGGAPAWDYAVTGGPGGRELSVEARYTRAVGSALAFDDGMGAFVDAFEVERGPAWQPVEGNGDLFIVAACERGPCRVRYRVRLQDAARTLDSRGIASANGDVLLAPPSSWLARPLRDERPGRYRFRVRLPPDASFVTGVDPVAGSPHTYEAGTDDLWQAPYSAFGPLDEARVEVSGATVDIAIAPAAGGPPKAEVVEWVERSSRAVAAFYGAYPVKRAQVIVLPGSRRPVGFGTTLGNGGASIIVWLGRGATREHLLRDWVLVHEMTHLGFPNVPSRQHWMEEGLATYVEPIARARAGLLPETDAWRGLVQGMPNGQPRADEPGFDSTRRWGALYWVGALFWFLADLEIRERTHGRRSVDDALRAIAANGGTIATRWPVARVLEVGDRATGTDVLRRMYARLGTAAAAPVDLDATWKRLGVVAESGRVSFDETAPLAAVRRAITGGGGAATTGRTE
jgi:predicted metalloprotease with PDZ domain